MVPILVMIHKVLLILSAAVVGGYLLFHGAKVFGAVLVSSRECFKSEPYYSAFLLLVTSVSTLTVVLEIIK